MTSIPRPSGVWTLRLGGISLLLHRRSWLMFTLLVLVLLPPPQATRRTELAARAPRAIRPLGVRRVVVRMGLLT